jgi:hypothetical protein
MASSVTVDDHQRRVWRTMIEVIDAYESGAIALQKLASDLRGLLGAADLHDQTLVTEFWNYFVEIDMELELRTEGWAPPGSSSDERLNEALRVYRRWAEQVLSETDNLRT